MAEITPLKAMTMRQDKSTNTVLVDVREDSELKTASIPGDDVVRLRYVEIQNVSRGTIELDEIIPRELEDKERNIITFCHHGMRSAAVAHVLQQNGYKNVLNMTGGIDQFSREVDASIPRY